MSTAEAGTLAVEVAYALPDAQAVVALAVAPGTTARECARRSGLAGRFPGLDVEHVPLGIWGRRVEDGHRVRAGDRVELYRPLPLDPRAARRARLRPGGA